MAGISTLGQALRQIENLNSQQALFGELSQQLATGKKAQFYSGLSTDALTSVRSRTAVTSLDVYINNINRTEQTINLTLQAVEEYQAQTNKLASTLTVFVQEGDHQTGDDVIYDDPLTTDIVEAIVVGNTSANVDADLSAVFAHAENLFNLLGELMNAKDGDRYLLAGADGSNPPYENTGTLDSALNTLITSWKNGTITTDELIADITDGEAFSGNPDAITDSTIGFSPSLVGGTAGDVFVRADDNSEFKYTTLANEKSFRDILVGIAVLKNQNFPPIVDVYEDGVYPGVPDAQGAPGTTAQEQAENFFEVYNAVSTMILQAVDDMDQIRFRTETVRAQMNETKNSHLDQKSLLQTTIGNVEDVDTNEVSVRLVTLQTQLEASYRVTATLQSLSLSNFL